MFVLTINYRDGPDEEQKFRYSEQAATAYSLIVAESQSRDSDICGAELRHWTSRIHGRLLAHFDLPENEIELIVTPVKPWKRAMH